MAPPAALLRNVDADGSRNRSPDAAAAPRAVGVGVVLLRLPAVPIGGHVRRYPPKRARASGLALWDRSDDCRLRADRGADLRSRRPSNLRNGRQRLTMTKARTDRLPCGAHVMYTLRTHIAYRNDRCI